MDYKRRSHNSIPPRWLHCPRKSNSLIAGKFLAFKCPLSSRYDGHVPEACRFPPSMLLNSMSSYNVKLGLWIDLTNTSRFYDKEDVQAAGVKYVKLQCRGHGECPSDEQTRAFVRICTKFISNNSSEVIGIHCTHGFNRTGFLIVSYLVENQSWSVEAALNAFSQARPPGIYKGDYLRELYARYGDVEDAPPTPTLPNWCNEPETAFDDDDGDVVAEDGHADNNTATPPHRRRKEFNKKNPTFMEGVAGVMAITEQPTLLQIQRKCQKMCDWASFGFPGSQPVSMDAQNLKLLAEKPYKVSWKADGTRYLMLIDGKNEVYFIDRDNCVFHVSNLRFPKRKAPHEHIADTLLDGEMVIDKVNEQPVPRYLVYDIVRFEGQEVGKADFDRRLFCIAKEIVGPRNQAIQDGTLDRGCEPFSVRAKQFYEIIHTRDLLADKFTKQLSHGIDGLIFQPTVNPYVPGQCVDVLKWKPPSLNSVDFKLSIHTETQTGMIPELKGYLFVGKLNAPFSEIKVTRELKKLDKKIIECKYENGRWQFMRERTDKSFPNSHQTAMSVCNSISNPVTKEILLEFIDLHRPSNKRPHDGKGNDDHIFKKPLL